MTTIPGVSNNELVRTTWGNAVATELNTNSVRRNGRNAANTAAEQMTGPLILPTTQSTDIHSAVHRDYVDSTFVNIAGATMTGLLTINAAGTEGLRIRGDGGNLSIYNEAGTARLGYLQGSSTDVRLVSESPVLLFMTDAGSGVLTERFRINGAVVLFGKIADEITSAGIGLYTGGTLEGAVRSVTGTTTALSNYYAKHISTADADGQFFLLCQRTDGTSVGTITQGPGNNTVFNAGPGGSHVATSDHRLKDDLGPITDPVGRVMALAPKHLRWRPESGSVGEFDNFIAHEVQAVVPDAVIGDKDAMWPADSPINPGQIRPQGLDTSKLVPLLTAALQAAWTTIADLTARVEALEAV